jgi:hypothetical protein
MTTANIEAIQDRCRELLRIRNQVDLEWIHHRRTAAQMNALYQAKMANAERHLKEARTRLKLALIQQRSSQALETLKEFVPVLNGDSERLADSLKEAKQLIAACDQSEVRVDTSLNEKHLPMLLETADGQIVLRARGL